MESKQGESKHWPFLLRSCAANLSRSFFNAVFPDDCRLCDQPLTNISRIPVCPACLSLPKPLEAEFFCKACRTPFVDSYPLDEHDLCTVCRESLVNFDACYSFGSFEGPLQKLIHLYKYGKIESLACPLSRLLIEALPSCEPVDVVIAMPMHWRKQWERGFNQAELLAESVARHLGVALRANLQRSRYTKPQAGLSETERQANLKGSFQVRRPEELSGKRILLIDDVFTTGATLRVASSALKRAGAARVAALTLARADRRFSSSFAVPRQPPQDTAAPKAVISV